MSKDVSHSSLNRLNRIHRKLFNNWKMNHQGNGNILAQMSILSAICENILDCYACDRWAWLEGQAPGVFQAPPAGGRVTLCRIWCHALNHILIPSLPYSCSTPCLPSIMYNMKGLCKHLNCKKPLWSFSQTKVKPFTWEGGGPYTYKEKHRFTARFFSLYRV